MLMTSTNNVNYNAVSQKGIYTRDRQQKYKTNLLEKNHVKQVSQGSILAVGILIAGLIY